MTEAKTFTAEDGKKHQVSTFGQYADFTQEDSLDVTLYSWAKVKGDNDILSSPTTAFTTTACGWIPLRCEVC